MKVGAIIQFTRFSTTFFLRKDTFSLKWFRLFLRGIQNIDNRNIFSAFDCSDIELACNTYGRAFPRFHIKSTPQCSSIDCQLVTY